MALEYLVDRTCSQMDFFLGLLSSGQKFHFCSADSCYLHKLACLSRNLLNEQEITKNMDHFKRTARWSGTFLQRKLIQILRGGLPFAHFCIDQQSMPKIYYINGRLKEVIYRSLKEICWKIILSYPRTKPRFQLANIVYFYKSLTCSLPITPDLLHLVIFIRNTFD